MSENRFLKRLFQAYYKERSNKIPIVNSFENREFGFIPWAKEIKMIRHIGFTNPQSLKKYLIDNCPRHAYSSGALYLKPENLNMDKKEYQGCDFIIDIDVDHFYTPCKDVHDIWWCKECNESGYGMIKKCPKCKKQKIKTLAWICEDCLETAKKEIIKLIYDFLIPDFGLSKNDMKIVFSGHRGYHLKIENKEIRQLTGEERREIVDYLSGDNISFEILGLKEVSSNIYGLIKDTIGWSQKITTKIEEILNYPNIDIEHLLLKFELNRKIIKSFLNSKEDFLQIISNSNQNLWNIEGFGLQMWKKFLRGIVREIGAKLDEPVSIDIHRLIRYPGSLHGKTGFKVQQLSIEELDQFNPLNESNKTLDPIVFMSKNYQKVEITEPSLPAIRIKDDTYGPYIREDVVEVPHHIAVYLLCKGVAKIK